MALQSCAMVDSVMDLDWLAKSTLHRIVEPILVFLCCLVGEMWHV